MRIVQMQQWAVILLLVAGSAYVTKAAGADTENYALEFAAGKYVELPGTLIKGLGQCCFSAWIYPTGTGSYAAIYSEDKYGGGAHGFGAIANSGKTLSVYVFTDGTTASFSIQNGVSLNTWQHLAVSYDGSKAYVYKDGVLLDSASASGIFLADGTRARIGGYADSTSGPFVGRIDEVQVWDRARTQDEIKEGRNRELFGDEPGLIGYWKFNEGTGTTASDSSPNKKDATIVGASWTTDAAPVEHPRGVASGFTPAAGAVDVSRNAVLSWTPGEFAATHDVYFGTSLADVSSASRANPVGTLVRQAQDANTYDPAGPLEFGQTYYWRVDEVNAAPSSFIAKGRVSCFIVELLAYPISNITATASSAQAGMGAERTLDGSGLDATGQHSTQSTDMWLSDVAGPQPTWIQYEFDAVYKLHEMWVWNSNQVIETSFGLGIKDATIEVSTDGSNWTVLSGTPEFVQASGQATYAHNTTVQCGGIAAKYVRITAANNWGGLVKQYSLSEVRFFYIPVAARQPDPASGSTAVAVDAGLRWGAGREAAAHKVYLSTNQQDVATGVAPVVATTKSSFQPGSLDFGRTYYWRVDEVNDAASPKSWTGAVWSFSVQEYAVVDDFESHNDKDHRIYDTWIDGMTTGSSGSVVGYLQAPFAEQTIVRGGRQSMPLEYNNVKTPFYSEAERTFDTPQNWTVHGADTLSLYLRGNPIRFTEPAPGKITMSAAGTDIWGTADQFRFAWKTLNGSGSVTVKVESLVNTNAAAKAGVMIRETLDPGSIFASMVTEPRQRVSFGWRQVSASVCQSATQDGVPTVQWLKLTRTGDVFTAQYSADGKTWTDIKNADGTPTATTIHMASTVYVGLCLDSASPGVATTADFSGIAATGAVTGAWRVADVGIAQPGNDPGPLYVAVEDSTGRTQVVQNSDPTAILTTTWIEWKIPLSQFTAGGVDVTRTKRLSIGVGDKNQPVPGGCGLLYIDDIGFGCPAPVEADRGAVPTL